MGWPAGHLVLLDEGADDLAGLDGHVLVILCQVRVKLVEQGHVVLGWDQVPLLNHEDGDLVREAMLIFDEGGEEKADGLLLEGEHLLETGGHGVLTIIELFRVFLEVTERQT